MTPSSPERAKEAGARRQVPEDDGIRLPMADQRDPEGAGRCDTGGALEDGATGIHALLGHGSSSFGC